MAEFSSPKPLQVRGSPFKTPPSSVRYRPYQLPPRRRTPRRLDFVDDSTPRKKPPPSNPRTFYNNNSFDSTPRKRPLLQLPPSPDVIDDESTPRKRPLLSFPSVSNCPQTTTPRKSLLGPMPHIPVLNQADFVKLGPRPNLRLIASKTSIIRLNDPMNCIFSDKQNKWYVADRVAGVVAISRDASHVLFTYTGFKRSTALALLDDGNAIAVLDDMGIHILDLKTGMFKPFFKLKECRGLGITAKGDFVTFDTARGQLLIIPQDGSDIITKDYNHKGRWNDENQPSRVSFIGVSFRRIVLVDYTLGIVTVYKYDSFARQFLNEISYNCSQNAAQCRLTGCFVDVSGRFLVANCKERLLFLFDHDGKLLQRVIVDDGFCRSGGIFVNSSFQTLVIDSHSQPPTARLYKMANSCSMENMNEVSKFSDSLGPTTPCFNNEPLEEYRGSMESPLIKYAGKTETNNYEEWMRSQLPMNKLTLKQESDEI